MRRLRLGEAKQLAHCQGAHKWYKLNLNPGPSDYKTQALNTRLYCLCKGRYFSATVLSTILFIQQMLAAQFDNLTSDKPGCIKLFLTQWGKVSREKRNLSWGR